MDIRIIHEELRQVFEAMSEQMEIIQQHKDKIPQIEIDLFMANVRDLYEACITLNKLNAISDTVSNPAETEAETREIEAIAFDDVSIRETFKFISQVEETPEPPVAQETEESSINVESSLEQELEDLFLVEEGPEREPDTEPETESETEPESLTQHEPIVLITPDPEPEPEPIVLITRKQEPVEPFVSQPMDSPNLFSQNPTTIADKLKEEKTTMNERLQSDSQRTSVGSRLHQNQIRDLKSAIGINEKFQFINDLFKGNMQDYTLAMTQLNQFSTFEEALEYIDILKFKYTWDINSDAHHKLMDFVRRRYL